jgi:sugar/nucleoside kinase (ribokinase family)
MAPVLDGQEIEAIVAGHLCLDIIPRIPTALGTDPAAYIIPGRLTEIGPATLSTGGAVPNTGVNLHRLGIRCHLMGKVGDDELGRATRKVIGHHSADLVQGMTPSPGEASSYTVVFDPPGADRMFLHYPGPNRTFGQQDIHYDILAQAKVFHFGYPPLMDRLCADGGRELASMLGRAKDTGVTTSLDLTLPDLTGPSGQIDWRSILARTLPYVDLFLPSVQELLFMLRRERFETLASRASVAEPMQEVTSEEIISLAGEALSMGTKVVMLKLGTRGAYLRTGGSLARLGRGAPEDLVPWKDRQLWAPCFKPTAVTSTVGTGDAAIAGFLAALLRGATPARALTVAVAAGASCVEEAGALAGVKGWEEILSRIDSGWPRLPLKIQNPGWTWDSHGEVWRGPLDRAME